MFFSKSNRIAILLLIGILAVAGGRPGTALAKNGIWWYGDDQEHTISLINLTDYKLIATYNQVSVWMYSGECYPYPFQYTGVNVDPYGSVIWKSVASVAGAPYYTGTITLLPEGMDQKWRFNLNFSPADPAHPWYQSSKGTWIYLTATDTTNINWVPTWDPSLIPDSLYLFYRGYATRLNDGHMHNLMNLEGTEIAVSVYSPDNVNIVVVVQQTENEPPTVDVYQAWKLDWVDNDGDNVP